jgi:hypothetical protein
MQVMVVVFFGSVLAKYGYFNEDKQKVKKKNKKKKVLPHTQINIYVNSGYPN